MILFAEDWLKPEYAGVVVDVYTKNKSFLRFAALLKKMGNKNHAFVLQLHNPSLQGVDPFDPMLTLEQQADIATECKRNFWYFIRECVRVPAIAGGGAGMFIANRGNIALYWLFWNHVTTLLIQIRQTGKSFGVNVLDTYLLNIRCLSTDLNLLTKDDDLRAKNIQNLKDIAEELPYYLKLMSKHDVNNTEMLTVKVLGNSFKGHLPNKSPKMALNVGRGLTSPFFHGDEVAFLFNIEITLPAILAAGVAARTKAKENGEPYGTILTTTAGKLDDRDGRYAYSLVEYSATWTEAFYDAKDIEELYLIIRKNTRSDNRDGRLTTQVRVQCTFNHRQLGYTDEWLRETIADCMVTGEAADRDFFNVWTSGSLTNPLPLAILERLRKSQVVDYYGEISPVHGYITRWYLDGEKIDYYMGKDHHVMSLDTSEASGGDDISLTITNVTTGELVAAGNYNETNLITFAQWLVTFFERFERLTCIIERKSTGAMIIDYLLLMLPAKGIDPFKRLFNWCVNDRDSDKERFKEIDIPIGRRGTDVYIRQKRTFGFATSGGGPTSRTELYSTTLQAAAKTLCDKVKDSMVIDQLAALTTRNGRIDHPEGGHDDMVISFLLGFWFMTRAKHLSHYGINPNEILVSKQGSDGKPITNLSRFEMAEQKIIRADIEKVYNEMQKERDEYVYKYLENRLVYLNSKLKLEEGEVFALDDLITTLRREKRFNRPSDVGQTNTRWAGVESGYHGSSLSARY